MSETKAEVEALGVRWMATRSAKYWKEIALNRAHTACFLARKEEEAAWLAYTEAARKIVDSVRGK